jgi:ADP-L-glycero-D-manno-heptose 6-epimerase
MWIVTGANGFIGSQMVRELNRRGIHDIIVVDPVTPQERPAPLAGTRFTKFLHRDELWDFLASASARDKVEWIVHMGANSSTTETNWDHLLEVNTHYTQKIFEWCATNTKPLIYASSAATYGAGEQGYDDETDSEKLKPLNLYGESKVLFDRWAVKQKNHPPHWYGLKFFNVYGPGEDHKGAMSSVAFKAFHQIRQSGKLQLFRSYRPQFKDGEQKRDFIYVKEVTNWMWELTMKTPASGIYNMGTGKARSWVDLARAVFSAMEKPEKIEFIEMPESLREQYQYFTEAKMDKWVRNGLSPSHWSLEEGVRDYIRNHLMKG